MLKDNHNKFAHAAVVPSREFTDFQEYPSSSRDRAKSGLDSLYMREVEMKDMSVEDGDDECLIGRATSGKSAAYGALDDVGESIGSGGGGAGANRLNPSAATVGRSGQPTLKFAP